jgi:hypothetical protein
MKMLRKNNNKKKSINKCNAFIEELCTKFDEEELIGNCKICGIKIAFHKRKTCKSTKITQNIVNNNYYASDNFSQRINNSVNSTASKDMFNLPIILLKTVYVRRMDKN